VRYQDSNRATTRTTFNFPPTAPTRAVAGVPSRHERWGERMRRSTTAAAGGAAKVHPHTRAIVPLETQERPPFLHGRGEATKAHTQRTSTTSFSLAHTFEKNERLSFCDRFYAVRCRLDQFVISIFPQGRSVWRHPVSLSCRCFGLGVSKMNILYVPSLGMSMDFLANT
jgi:hypothetical protein